LPPTDKFIGAGLYAIYYKGDFPAYKRVSAQAQNPTTKVPVYVGKAIPEGARKGGFGLDVSPGTKLYARLREHATSIRSTGNLKLADFFCQYLVVEDIWIPLGENMLIERFKPIWNRLLDGFGNHAVGSGRDNSQRPSWDMMHPGRGWAEKLKAGPKAERELAKLIEAALAEQFPDPN
jgi:hypothetical protein